METKPESLEMDANCSTVEAKKRRDHQDKVLEVCRTSDRVMAVKIVLSDNVWTIVSAYAPQVGCDEDTKNAFWNELEAVIMKVPHKEKLILAGDLSGHVGES